MLLTLIVIGPHLSSGHPPDLPAQTTRMRRHSRPLHVCNLAEARAVQLAPPSTALAPSAGPMVTVSEPTQIHPCHSTGSANSWCANSWFASRALC